jgi:hypothetical protein
MATKDGTHLGDDKRGDQSTESKRRGRAFFESRKRNQQTVVGITVNSAEIRTVSKRSPVSVIRTNTDRCRCKSIPQSAYPHRLRSQGPPQVVNVSTPSLPRESRGAEAPLLMGR